MPGTAGRRVMLYVPREVHSRLSVLPATVSLSGLFRRAALEACRAAEAHRAGADHDLGDDPDGCAECSAFVNGQGVWAS